MVKVLVSIVAASVILAGCASVDVYTEKRERVDQELSGNRGFMAGQKDDMPEGERKKERTLINVDIGLFSSKGIDDEDESIAGDSGEMDTYSETKEEGSGGETTVIQETTVLKDGTVAPKSDKKEKVILKDGTEAEKEDDYIK